MRGSPKQVDSSISLRITYKVESSNSGNNGSIKSTTKWGIYVALPMEYLTAQFITAPRLGSLASICIVSHSLSTDVPYGETYS